MKRKDYFCRAAACIVLLLASVRLAAQPADTAKEGETLTFTFAPASDLFTLRGNEAELARLSSLIDTYRSEITAGRMPIAVDGYCASLPSRAGNLRTAYLRANRVKSELITRKGLTEDAFVTANYATAFGERKDVVVVTLRIPAEEIARQEIAGQARNDKKSARSDKESARSDKESAGNDRGSAGNGTKDARSDRDTTRPAVILNSFQDLPKQEADASGREIAGQARNDKKSARSDRKSADNDKKNARNDKKNARNGKESARNDRESTGNGTPYTLALRTNLLYDALLLPTLGIEWRIDRNIGVRLDGSLSRWGGSAGKVQKMWLVNPEVRYYLLRDRRFYLGASATYGEYNLYGYPLGNLLRDDTGYQGHLWNAGLSLGYQLRLCRALSADFNLGLGYTRSEYDSFTLIDRTRVSRERNRKKSFAGPTQAGISLVWTIGGKE